MVLCVLILLVSAPATSSFHILYITKTWPKQQNDAKQQGFVFKMYFYLASKYIIDWNQVEDKTAHQQRSQNISVAP